MKMMVFTVYDKVSEQFAPLFLAPNIASAARSVREMKLKAYRDFELISVGVFDMRDGVLIGSDENSRVFHDWVNKEFVDNIESQQLNFAEMVKSMQSPKGKVPA